jgi:hypothetical protein
MAPDPIIETTSDGSNPRRRVIAGFTSPPRMLPTALAVHNSPYPRASICSVLVASSTRVAWPIWLQKPSTPSRIATVRSSRCLVSQRTPSATWARMPPAWPAAGAVLGSLASSAADPANDTASSPNGSAARSANSALPTGGPRNVSPIVSATYWFPLALGNSSGGTSAGSTDCAALLKMTSALPSRNPPATSTAMSASRVRTRTASTAVTAHWTAWARHISAARS